jgi:hypothetical protein
MLRQILTVAAFAGMLGAAQAGDLLERTEHGAEVPLAELGLPATQGGILRYAFCEGCETQTAVMPTSTVYVVNHQAVAFEDFAATVDAAQESSEITKRSIVGLYFDTATKRLVRIALVTPLTRQQ